MRWNTAIAEQYANLRGSVPYGSHAEGRDHAAPAEGQSALRRGAGPAGCLRIALQPAAGGLYHRPIVRRQTRIGSLAATPCARRSAAMVLVDLAKVLLWVDMLIPGQTEKLTMAGLLNIGITGLNAAQSALVANTTTSQCGHERPCSRQVRVLGTQQPLFSGQLALARAPRSSRYGTSYNAPSSKGGSSPPTASARSSRPTRPDRLAPTTCWPVQTRVCRQRFNPSSMACGSVCQPSSVPAGQSMISAAQSLVATFQYLDGRMSVPGDGIEGQIGSTVAEINAYASEIADINQRIAVTESAGTGQQANDLRDQRDTLDPRAQWLCELQHRHRERWVGVGLRRQRSAAGDRHQRQHPGDPASKGDPSRSAIALQTPGGGTVTMPESLLEGGQLGGLLAFRRGQPRRRAETTRPGGGRPPLASTAAQPRPGSRWRLAAAFR